MWTIGVDAHKWVHQAVVVDEVGREQATRRGRNSPDEWVALRTWAGERPGERRWAIEGAWS